MLGGSVARAERREKVEHGRCEQELDKHMETGGEERKWEVEVCG